MANEFVDELVLSPEESTALVHNLLHPNIEACMRRDEFLRGLEGLEISFANGEIIAECPDIQISVNPSKNQHSLYDEKKKYLEIASNKIMFEQLNEREWLSSTLFIWNQQTNYPVHRDDDKWTANENVSHSTMPTAA